jgi:hypothetical protein
MHAVRWRLSVAIPVALVCAVLAALARATARPIGDPDLWWHLRLGSDLIGQRSLSAPAHWAPAATQSWVPTEPLPEIMAAKFDEWFGLAGVAWLYAAGLSLVLLSVYSTNRFRASAPASCVAALAALLGAGLSLGERPQLLSLALVPVALAAWMATERDLRPRWWLVPVTWLWSLIHGYWILCVGIGALMVLAILVEQRPGGRTLAPLATVPLLCAGVVLLNPVGIGVFEAPLAVHEAGKWVGEWQRTDLTLLYPQVTLVMLAVTVVGWVVARRRVPVSRLLLLALSVFLVWYANRTVAVASMLAAPLLAESLDGLPARSRSRRDEPAATRHRPERRELAALAGWTAACLVVLACALPRVAVTPYGVPLALDSSLRAVPAGTTVFNTYGIGGWLTWRYPDLHQVIDGLVTPYPVSYQDAYHNALNGGSGWDSFVERTGARVALLQDGTPLIADLRHAGWSVVQRGDGYVLLRHPGTGPAGS